jgi:Rab-GTPase-TBC domain
VAFAQYEPVIGYVQGMNFIAASLLFHANEVCTFWLLIGLMDKFGMNDIFRQGLPGLKIHDQ